MSPAPEPSERRTGWVLALIFLLLVAGILTAGYGYYRNYERRFRALTQRKISAIADLKVDELALWRKERLGDAGLMFQNAPFAGLVRRFLENPRDQAALGQLEVWLGKLQNHQYAQVLLLDAQGAVRLALPAPARPEALALAGSSVQCLRGGQVAFLDFHRATPDRAVGLDLLVPLFDEAQRALGVLVLCVDPAMYLYPFIRRWPTLSRTAETLLVRREGQDAVFLNELRFQTNAALQLRRSLADTDNPAVQAVLGQIGPVAGRDYRGRAVIGAVRPIPESPWFLVAKIDTAEADEPLREERWKVLLLIVTLLFGAGAGVGMIWRHQRVQFYKERAVAAEALRASQERLATTLHSIGDAVISTDLGGRVSDMNPVAEKLTGWALAEARGRELPEVFRIFSEDSGAMEENPATKVLREGRVIGLANHTELAAKDGTRRPIADSGAPIRDLDGRTTGVVLVFRDVTRERQNERALRESSEQVASILASISDAFFSLDDHLVVNYFNDAAERLLHRRRQEVLGRNLFEAFPEARGSVFEVNYTQALQERKPVTFETYFNREPYREWYEVRVYPQREGLSVYFQVTTERKQMEGTQLFLAQCAGAGASADFFQGLARHLGENLGADYVCIDRLEATGLTARTVAVYHQGRFEENVTYALKDTPCGEVVGRTIGCYPRGVRELFPRDAVLQDLQAESYVGTTLWSAQGRPIGLIALIWRTPLANPELAKSLLQLVGVRAAGELERGQAEEALRQSSEEKDSLLKEVHHRVKNNLQIVVSLLHLQANRVQNPGVQELLRETQSRVRAMALLHETLYRSTNLAHLNFATYLSTLCKHLLRSYGPETARLKLNLRVADVPLGLDHAVPCGLIINELVSNALKYAFPEGRAGEISLELEVDGAVRCPRLSVSPEPDTLKGGHPPGISLNDGPQTLVLRVTDTGVGLPPDFDLRRTRSLGLQLVFNLARQLRGTAEWEPGPGTRVAITFPAPQPPRESL